MNPMKPINPQANARRRGISLAEMLVSLAITAMLLTATMVATNACFIAYADASDQVATQAATRMVTHRLLALLRTSTAHGPLLPDASSNPPVTLSGNTLTSPYVEMLDAYNRLVRVEYRPTAQELWLITSNPDGSNKQAQPLLGGVTSATFTCLRRRTAAGQYVLERATMDLSITPGGGTMVDGHAVLSLEEKSHREPIRVVGSTKPRKLADE